MPPPRPPGLFNLHGNPDTIADLPSAPTYDSTAAAEPADLPRFTSLPPPGRPRTRGHLLPHVHIDGQRSPAAVPRLSPGRGLVTTGDPSNPEPETRRPQPPIRTFESKTHPAVTSSGDHRPPGRGPPPPPRARTGTTAAGVAAAITGAPGDHRQPPRHPRAHPGRADRRAGPRRPRGDHPRHHHRAGVWQTTDDHSITCHP